MATPGVGSEDWFRSFPALLVAGALFALLFSFAFHDGLVPLFDAWSNTEEYSHGWLIFPIAVFLLWQNRAELLACKKTGTWVGVLVAVFGFAVFFVGELATLYVLTQYAMLIVIWGAFIATFGLPAARKSWAPLVFLIFMVPLPSFLYQQLSGFLQLISSELGVVFIRAFGISVFLEGNVIDLGTYKLQVVEACNGLRYLFPLMSFGFICAYLFNAPVWQRLVIFLSTIPITVAMNSIRIGIIGIMVEHWGTSMAEGFLHDFEGWAIFMICVAILFAEMWLLTVLTRRGVRLRDVFWPPASEDAKPVSEAPAAMTRPTRAVWVTLTLTALASWGSGAVEAREEVTPERSHFSSFPMELGGWQGRRDTMDEQFVLALKFTDYILADYRRRDDVVNFYAAYYQSQRKGESAHSPRSCIPGGGWRIESLEQVEIPQARFAGKSTMVNRVEIRKGNARQLVYYWFQQRGRVMTNEYLVKASIVWDSMTRGRTDGALIRLTTALRPDEEWADGDKRLSNLARELSGQVPAYVPS